MLKFDHILWPVLVILLTRTLTLPTAQAAKILGLFAHPSESHFAVMRAVMMELARREHNVTIYSSHRLSERVDNLQEHIIEPEYPFWRKLQLAAGIEADRGGLYALSQLPAGTLQKHLAQVGAAAVDYFLTHTTAQQLSRSPAAAFDFDLIIVDLFYTEALLAFGHYHATPTIAIVSSNFEHYMTHVLESLVPAACTPQAFESPVAGTATPSLGYWQRLANIRDCRYRRQLFAEHNLAAQSNLIRKHFSHFKVPAPTIPELQANLAVVLLNNHVPLAAARPLLPNIVAAGGLHIHRPRELPWHIRRFLDEARDGAIYMHLGNEQLCGEIPHDKLQTLFNVFGKSRARVLWTCHDVQQMEGLPKNVMLQHDVPQTDILAHPHVKLFVMNGDLLGLQEGIVRHVPMLGVPLFRNEHANMELAVRIGVGLQLDYANFTDATLAAALQTVLRDGAAYPVAIRQVSAAFRDRPLGALETTMYWVDYVLRHNGGAAIKTPGVGTPLHQLHLFDLFVFYFGLTLLYVVVLLGGCYAAFWLWRHRQVRKMYSKLS